MFEGNKGIAAILLLACNASTVPSDLGDPCSAEDTALAMTRGQPNFDERYSERFIPSTSCQSGMCYAPTRLPYEECLAQAENNADLLECDITQVIGGPRNHCTIPCEPGFRDQPDVCPAAIGVTSKVSIAAEWNGDWTVVISSIA